MTSVLFDLETRDFRSEERCFAKTDLFQVTTFRYPLGVAALRISNSVGRITVLPFQGQQIWDAAFFGRRLTMKSVFDEPRPTDDFLATYGAFLIHCGLTAVGPPGPGDTHPPHGELPNAPFESASVELGEDNAGPFAAVRGRYSYKRAFHSDYRFETTYKLRRDTGRIEISLTATNLKKTDMELMYLAHANFRATAGIKIIDTATGVRVRSELPSHVSPSQQYLEMLQRAQSDPPGHKTIEPDDRYDPELVFYLDFADEEPVCLARHGDGTADFIRWNAQQLPRAVRWISRTPDQECLGLALPATTDPHGYINAHRNGQLISLRGGESFQFGYELGCLSAREAEDIEAQIARARAAQSIG